MVPAINGIKWVFYAPQPAKPTRFASLALLPISSKARIGRFKLGRTNGPKCWGSSSPLWVVFVQGKRADATTGRLSFFAPLILNYSLKTGTNLPQSLASMRFSIQAFGAMIWHNVELLLWHYSKSITRNVLHDSWQGGTLNCVNPSALLL